MIGRPSKMTPEAARAIVMALRRGGDWHDAAKAAGISRSTLYAWEARGRRGEPQFAALVRRMDRETQARYARQRPAEDPWPLSATLFRFAIGGRVPVPTLVADGPDERRGDPTS